MIIYSELQKKLRCNIFFYQNVLLTFVFSIPSYRINNFLTCNINHNVHPIIQDIHKTTIVSASYFLVELIF